MLVKSYLPLDDNNQEFLQLSIGKNVDYYMGKWRKHPRPEQKSGWNWAAFFFGIYWMGYRKMYASMFSLIGVMTVADVVFSVIDFEPKNSAWLLLPFITGSLGNSQYYYHINRVYKKHSLEPLRYPPEQDGGTSLAGIFTCFGAMILSIGISSLITG